MRYPKLALTAAAAVALCAGSAAAQGWVSINQRQARLDDRIEAGIRTGDLTRAEARRLRIDFRDLSRLEAHYRRDGLSRAERVDLDRRFDALSARIRIQRTDWQRDWFGGRDWRDRDGRWVPIDRREAQLDRRIDQGVRHGQLTRSEAARLRAEFRQIERMEHRYRRGGLSNAEVAALDRRFDELAQQIRWERRDDQRRYGWNR
jgi:hypothetical protein